MSNRTIQIPNLKPGTIVSYQGWDYEVASILIRKFNLYVKFKGFDHLVPVDEIDAPIITVELHRSF